MRKTFVVATAVLLTSQGAMAQSDQEILKELQQLKSRISQLEQALKEKNAREEQVENEVKQIKEKLSSLEIHGGVRLYYQGASVDKIDGKKFSNPSGAGYDADLELTFKPDSKGEFYMRLHSGAGTGADKIFEEAEEPLFANLNTLADSNPDKDGDLQLLEVYYNRSFFGDKVNVLLGKTEPFALIDDNEYANDEASQFVGKPFVNNPILDSEDTYGPMIGITMSPADNFEIAVVLQSNDSAGITYSGGEWTQKEKSVYDDVFDQPFYAVQLKYSPELNGLKGNYRIYFWDDSADHIKIGEPANNSSRKPGTADGWGVGVSFDQQVSENIGLFFRAAYGNDDVYEVEKFVSLGASINGLLESRPNDTLGVGVAALIPNDKLENNDTEYHFEAYYRMALSDNLFITPDIQYVINPHGSSDNDNIFAGMVRAEFSF